MLGQWMMGMRGNLFSPSKSTVYVLLVFTHMGLDLSVTGKNKWGREPSSVSLLSLYHWWKVMTSRSTYTLFLLRLTLPNENNEKWNFLDQAFKSWQSKTCHEHSPPFQATYFSPPPPPHTHTHTHTMHTLGGGALKVQVVWRTDWLCNTWVLKMVFK